jgi:hypothetical protein
MLTKVVYNSCYGGFSISSEALTRMKELGYTGEDSVNSLHNGCAYLYDCARHNPILVQVVEELGKKANGISSDLKIAQVFGPYRIEEYDGSETVVEPDDYEWITP